MHVGAFVHAVSAMEMNGIGVVLMEEAEGVHQIVLVAEEPPYTLAFTIVHTAETLVCHPFILLHQVVVYKELLHTVFTGIEEGLCSRHAMLHHRLADFEGGVEHDAVIAVEHLGIHTTHRGADDEVGLFCLAHPVEQRKSLIGMKRHVFGYHRGIAKHFAQAVYRTRAGRGAEAVYIHHFLPSHHVGKLFQEFVLCHRYCVIDSKCKGTIK